MAWFTRFTRFGDVHLVYGQEAGCTCGPASVLMCVFKLNKLEPGKESLVLEKQIVSEYKALYGKASYNEEKEGTLPQHLATILNRYTSGNWRWHKVPVSHVADRLVAKVGVTGGIGPTVDVNPVILGVDWDLGGAHWVVVDTVRTFMDSKYATVCDPWDTNVHIQKFNTGHPFVYCANEGGLMFNFWGKSIAEERKLPYGNTDRGMVKTWGMLYRD